MSDRMRPIPFGQLIRWILEEYKKESAIFGVPAQKFFSKSNGQTLNLFGDPLENPFGPAAGPNTQLAQNIIAAYVAGCRFFELKTVQTLDGEDLPVAKPCIWAKDEGYNVEWSTELTVQEALNEYVKAWFVLHLLSKELSLGSNRGLVFNMSVGYDLEGIKTQKIDLFIESLMNASETQIWKECKEFILDHLEMFKNISTEYVEDISPQVCKSITLSTLHGCPPDEIERIAKYLLKDKKLNTFVKLNPTLLGYEFVRDTLNRAGYEDLAFDDHHFRNDLQYSDAVPMISRLKSYAEDLNLNFGVKLTNTFPVKITKGELPGEEMYMSGKPLYPLTIHLAYQLAKEFHGDLRISYSGGADFFNISEIFEAGIWPVTLATTILKPGGYLRLKQIADSFEKGYTDSEFKGVNIEKLKLLAEKAVQKGCSMKSVNRADNPKLHKKVPLTDCFIAPCSEACPIGQDIPEYVRLTGDGKYLEALELIAEKNPLPFITGTLCTHRCMTRCTRVFYDEAVEIRSNKLLAAQTGYEGYMDRVKESPVNSDIKAAVIGGGPAGLSAAYFLRKKGIDVTVFDRKHKIGGIIEWVAPRFRISEEAINQDMELIRKTGVQFCLGADPEFSIEALKKVGFKYIFIAIGAWKPGRLKLDSCDREIINVLDFLEKFNQDREHLEIGKNIAVIGGGNSAMDAARAAKRIESVEHVYLVYRRTSKYMPANREELELALEEGVELKELLLPVTYNQGILKCQRMELGAPDSSGRRSPVAVQGKFVELEVDNIIAAVGEKVELELLTQNGIKLDEYGNVKVDPRSNETSVDNVFIGGDALRGPATIVEGIADGMKFAQTVMEREKTQESMEYNQTESYNESQRISEILGKRGVLQYPCGPEKDRCLECSKVCNLCVEVCPNRANIVIRSDYGGYRCRNQVLHMDGMCNECGNCAMFCPYDSAPYREKLTLYWSFEDFEESRNAGFVLIDETVGKFLVRLGDSVEEIAFDSSGKWTGSIPKEVGEFIWAAYSEYKYLF
ncbi:MAG: putative selenate reductase subunit YgfK [Clostridia bacterium]|nr:putative selenate reductase subunit YgfK [Clostridia bacterium]